MGEVYRARDTRLGREVALKVLPPQVMADREGLLRFAQEARSASALNHPNIITIFEIGSVGQAPFLAMELIEGTSLRDLIDAGPLSVKKTLEIATQIAEGLAKAHQAGIIHRDVKPENIMITRDGFAKILDFGLAKLQGKIAETGAPGNSLTQAGFIIGTPDYMSPEQAAGRPLDFRSDQFSIGLVFYEMLTGRRVFHRPTAVQTLSAIIQDEAEAIENVNARVPPPLRWIIARCLAKDPEERYASTRDLARDLKQIRDNAAELAAGSDPRIATGRMDAASLQLARQTRTRIPAVPPPPPRSAGRRAAELAGMILLGMALLGGGVYLGHWLRGKQIEPPPPNWRGELLLGSMTRVFSPRLSPDGQTLAFGTLVGGGSAQVAVMKPSSGDWTILTRRRNAGSVQKVCWSRDGNKIFFDRVSDVPHGVFSVPPLGGEERVVLEQAQGPEALPDGTLLVVRRDAVRNFAVHRFWPDTGKIAAIGPSIVAEGSTLAIRAFPDGQRAVFWGRLAGSKDPARRAYVLDIASGAIRPLAGDLPIAPPLAIGADGRSVLAIITAGDLQQVVSVAQDATDARVLFPVTGKPWQIDAASDGSVYVDTVETPGELLRFGPAGGAADRVMTTAGALLTSPVELPEGGLLVPSQVLGRRRLLVARREGELAPLLDISEQATPPATVLAGNRIAFLSGPVGKPPMLTIASITEGRILRRLEASSGVAPQSLAASPDGRTLYYVDGGSLYSIDAEGAGAPRKLRPGNAVALDAHGSSPTLVVQVNDVDGVKLYRVPLGDTASELPIAVPEGLRLAPAPLSSAAVAPDGRIAVTVTSRDSWFRSAAILDPPAATLTRVPVAFDGDVLYPAWAHDGALLATGVSIQTTLWRFLPHAPSPER